MFIIFYVVFAISYWAGERTLWEADVTNYGSTNKYVLNYGSTNKYVFNGISTSRKFFVQVIQKNLFVNLNSETPIDKLHNRDMCKVF